MATAKRTRKPKAEKAAKYESVAATAKSAPDTKISARAADINEAVSARAYELYARRGYTHGHDFDDWLRAESEVLGSSGA